MVQIITKKQSKSNGRLSFLYEKDNCKKVKRLDINEKLIFLKSYFSTTNVLTIKEINKEGNKKV